MRRLKIFNCLLEHSLNLLELEMQTNCFIIQCALITKVEESETIFENAERDFIRDCTQRQADATINTLLCFSQCIKVKCDSDFLWVLSFLFILRWMLTNLDLVVYRLSYYFINVLNGLKHFYDKIKVLIESKDSKIYFCNKLIICRLNMYLKVLLYYLRSILYVK